MKMPILPAVDVATLPRRPYPDTADDAGGRASVVLPQDCGCAVTGGTPPAGDGAPAQPIYVKGAFVATFPSMSVEKEFYQAAPANAPHPPTNQLLFDVLRQTQNIYIAREMCWVFKIEGIESYVVRPTSYAQLTALISAIAPRGAHVSYDVLAGVSGATAPPDLCNGRVLPVATPQYLYTFTVDGLVAVVAAYLQLPPNDPWLVSTVGQMLQLSDNEGTTDAHRAINLVALRYLGVYKTLKQLNDTGFVLTRVRTDPSRVQGDRTIVNVIFVFDRSSGAGAGEQWYCRVDTTGPYPYLVSGMVKYFDRP